MKGYDIEHQQKGPGDTPKVLVKKGGTVLGTFPTWSEAEEFIKQQPQDAMEADLGEPKE